MVFQLSGRLKEERRSLPACATTSIDKQATMPYPHREMRSRRDTDTAEITVDFPETSTIFQASRFVYLGLIGMLDSQSMSLYMTRCIDRSYKYIVSQKVSFENISQIVRDLTLSNKSAVSTGAHSSKYTIVISRKSRCRLGLLCKCGLLA